MQPSAPADSETPAAMPAEEPVLHRLFFVRHAEAGEQEDWPGDDESRPVSPKGRKRMKASREGYRAALGTPALVLTSHYARAKETADALAKFLRLEGGVVEERALGHGGDPAEIARILRERTDTRDIALVGHSPDLERWISRLVCGDAEAGVLDLKKGGVARVDVLAVKPEPRGRLRWILTPGLLRDIEE